ACICTHRLLDRPAVLAQRIGLRELEEQRLGVGARFRHGDIVPRFAGERVIGVGAPILRLILNQWSSCGYAGSPSVWSATSSPTVTAIHRRGTPCRLAPTTY